MVCADDFALNAPVSRAIAQLAGQGRLTATSAMVLSPLWLAHATWLAPLRGRIDVGLHLDWTSDFAQAAGQGLALGPLMLRAASRRLDPHRVREAIERQVDLFEDGWGAPPDHVDGHQHVHQFPVIREQLVRVLARRYPRGPGRPRPWLRISRPLRPGTEFKSRVIGAMGARALARLADREGFAHSEHLTGIYGFDLDRAGYLERLGRWLTQCGQTRQAGGVVLMCHPGEAAPAEGDPIARARAVEYDVLGSDDWLRLLQARLVQLARGAQGLA